MSLLMLSGAALGAAVGAGVLALVVVLRGGSLFPTRSTGTGAGSAGSRWQPRGRRWAVAAVAGVVVLVVTRWPVAAAAAAAVVVLWPHVFGGTAAGQRQLGRIEALAAWTESLRDTAHTAAGLEQAIPATVDTAPAVLAPPLRDLEGRLASRVPLPEALARFADDLTDPTADMVVAAMILNARQRSAGLVRTLTALAGTARAELEMRRQVESERRRLRRHARIIATGLFGFVTTQAVLAPAYLQPYSTVAGQMVLAVLLAVFVGAFIRMRKLSEPQTPARFLTSADAATEVASYRVAVSL